MIVQALKAIRVNMPTGSVDLVPGQTIELSPELGEKLLRLAPGRVQMAKAEPFPVGARVAYRIPDPQSKRIHPAWQEHSGVILAVNTFAEMVLIQPHDEPGTPWRWLWWGYVEKSTNET